MMVVKKMIKTIRVMLIPNNKQKTKLFQYANTARFAYNWALGREKENYKNGGKFLSDSDLRKEFTQLKKTEEYSWLNEVSNNVTKQAIKDACHAYKRFFKGCSKFPKFKSRKFSIPSFYQDNVKIQFSDTHVKIEGFAASKKKNKQKINWIRLAEKNRIPMDCNYSNPRIRYDGINWWITVGIEYEDSVTVPSNDGIGIDQEDIPKIWDRFYRVDKSRSRENGGTGLGLSMVHFIVAVHGGQIHVESKNGEGTSFIFQFPKM